MDGSWERMAKFTDVRQIRLEDLIPSPQQARVRDVEKNLDELVDNIRAHGQLEPIIVTPRSEEHGKYEIVAGQRRWLAMRQLGMETISASVLDQNVDEATAHVLSISENLIRRDLNSKDIIDACTRLYRKYGSVKAVAEELGLPYSRVRSCVKYDRLRPGLKELVESGDLDVKAALRVEDHFGDEMVDSEGLQSVAKAISGMTSAQQADYLKITKGRALNGGKVPAVSGRAEVADLQPGAVTQIVVTLRRDNADRLRKWSKQKRLTQDKGAAAIIEAFFRRMAESGPSDQLG
jgi:ParB family chromosome partitioning protein